MKACYAQQMRDIDKAASDIGGIPGVVLMENAAISCVDELKKDFRDLEKKSVAIFCGKGNNGGDGFAIARHLYNIGTDVKVYTVYGCDLNGDALINFEIIEKMGVPVEQIADTDMFDYVIKSYDIIVDAILGTGIKGDVRGIAKDIIPLINENAKYIMSVDIPSGVDSDTGEIGGVCIRADKTVTFAAYKVGMFLFPAADYMGEIVVKDISIPQYIIESEDTGIDVTDDEFIRNNFPKRKNNSQKGNYGKVLVIAGSKGMTGAAYLSSQTAMLSGSGLVTLAVCEEINPILEAKTTEVMTLSLTGFDGHISKNAEDKILSVIDNYDAILIGPGLGRSEDVNIILRAVLKNSKVPVVIDADGINAASLNMNIIDECVCTVIFTPHAVEMSRLVKLDKDFIEANRLEISRAFAKKYGATLLLKGRYTVVTAPDEKQYINITGNSGLATGGSGDVLAGILVSLVARGTDETMAAAMAAYIHGTAGDIAASLLGKDSVTAMNIMNSVPKALCQILQVEKP